MQWTVQVLVVVLNVAWIVFFLHPDPLSVSVQRRSSDSSDEEMLFGEFCIQPHFETNWTSILQDSTTNKTYNNNTAAKPNRTSSPPLKETNSLNKTKIRPEDLQTSNSSENDCRLPASGCKAQIINLDETPTPPQATPSVQRQTPSEVTTALQLVSTSSSETAPVKVTRRSEPPVREKDNQNPKLPPPVGEIGPDCCFKFYPRRIKKTLIRSYYMTDDRCPKPGVILVSQKSRHICADPGLSWVESIMKSSDETY